jgi:hypothetical protein
MAGSSYRFHCYTRRGSHRTEAQRRKYPISGYRRIRRFVRSPVVWFVSVKSAKRWFRTRLTENGHGDDVLCISQKVVTVRRLDGLQLAVRYQDEKIVDLR